MTCVSIETFHLWRFIVSLIVDPFTPLRGRMPQKGKQGFSFKEYRDRNTAPRSWRCWVWQRREVCEYFSGKFWFETLSRKTFRTPWLSPFVSITDICFFPPLWTSCCKHTWDIFFYFLFYNLWVSFHFIIIVIIMLMQLGRTQYTHPSIFFAPVALPGIEKVTQHPSSWSHHHRRHHHQHSQVKAKIKSIWCGWNFCNLEWMGHQMLIMKGMVKFQTRKEYIP